MKQRIFNILSFIIVILPFMATIGGSATAFTATKDTQIVTLHKYAFDTTSQALPDIENDGTDKAADITKNNNAKPLQGIRFTAYDVTENYVTSRKKGADNETTFKVLKDLKATDLTSNQSYDFAATDNSGVTSQELPVTSTVNGKEENAVYVIMEAASKGDVQVASNMVISLPFYEKDGTTPMSNVNLYPKNTLNLVNLDFTKYGVTGDNKVNPLAGANFVLKNAEGQYLNKTLANGVLPTFGDQVDNTDVAKFTSDKAGKVSTEQLFSQGLALSDGDYTYEELSDNATGTTVGNEKDLTVDDTTHHVYHIGSEAKKTITFTVNAGKITNVRSFDKSEAASTEKAVYNYEVPAPKKNVEKTVNDNGIDINAPIQYTVTENIPLDIATYTQFALTDTPDKALEIDTANTITATVTASDGKTTTVTPKFVKNTDGFTLDFFAVADAKAAVQASPGGSVTFKYSAKVKQGVSPEADINNEISFANNHTPIGNKTTKKIHTYGAQFVKQDAYDSSKTLAGAEFMVLNEDKTKYRTSDDNWKTYTEGTTPTDAAILKSDKTGKFAVTGLQVGTYNLKETKAPTDYQLPAKPYTDFKVTPTSFSKTTELKTIVNTQKGVLPHTGGIGIILFILVGIAIIGMTIVYFKKRQQQLNA